MKKILTFIMLLTIFSCSSKNDEQNTNNKLAYTKDTYYVYYNQEIIKIPANTYITKDKNIDSYFFSFFGKHIKAEKQLKMDLNRYFPLGITEIVKLDKDPEDSKEIPLLDIETKKIVDPIKLSELLSGDVSALVIVDDTSEIIQIKDTNAVSPEISLEGKTVHILNANGINGFAKKLGESFNKNLGMEYIAENNSEKTDMSYVINHKLTKQEFNKFVNSVGLKYIKIKEDNELMPEADVVLITGNDSKVKFPIEIQTKYQTSTLTSLLSEYKPSLKKIEDPDNKIIGITIKYNSEDKVIAEKILSYIPSAKLEEDNNLKDKIEIVTDR